MGPLSRTLTFAIPVTLAIVAFAGCIDNGTTPTGPVDGSDVIEPVDRFKTPPVPDFDFTTAIDIVHNHNDATLHGNNFGLKVLGYDDLTEGWTYPYTGGFIEVDVYGDLAVVGSLMPPRGFTLVDISDKANPQVLSHMYSYEDNWDVRFSEDGKYAFMGCQALAPNPVGACADVDGVPTVPSDGDNGVVTVDISDPANPQAICYTETGSVHNLETALRDDGTHLVAVSAGELYVMKEDGCLEQTAEFAAQHDVALQKHPITGNMFLYTGTSGMTIYNVDDPRDIYEVGILDTAGVAGATAWHEQSPAPNLIRGKHVTIGAGERSTGQPGPVTVIDTTDPATPVAMGSWILPVPPPMGNEELYAQQGYMFSEHNAQVSPQGQVCIGHYHAGLWIIDISTEERMKEPVTLAFFQPNEISANVPSFHPAGGAWLGSPYVWGCAWTEDGRHVVIADNNSGIYVLEPEFLEPVDPAVA